MTEEDNKELYRLCELLKEVDGKLDTDSQHREALQKAAIALSISFIKGYRNEVENWTGGIGRPLSEDQRAYLSSIGINPEQ